MNQFDNTLKSNLKPIQTRDSESKILQYRQRSISLPNYSTNRVNV